MVSDTFFITLSLYTTTIDLKQTSQDENEVLTISFDSKGLTKISHGTKMAVIPILRAMFLLKPTWVKAERLHLITS